MAKECFVPYLVEMVLEKKNKNDKSLQTDQRQTKYKIKHVKSYNNTSVKKKPTTRCLQLFKSMNHNFQLSHILQYLPQRDIIMKSFLFKS